MNVADSEVVASVMGMAGYSVTDNPDDADAILLNTCSIRDNAEQKIVGRLQALAAVKRKRGGRLIVGVIGCMAERVKDDLIANHGVDLVAGPNCLPQSRRERRPSMWNSRPQRPTAISYR